MEKTCTRCSETKPIEEFAKSKQVKSGYGAWCKECTNAARRESAARIKAANPEAYNKRQRQYVARYKSNHPDRVAQKDWAYALKSRFNISVERYFEMLEGQGGACAGCGTKPNGKRLAIDHDRKCCSGNKSCGDCVRGLLCGNCNTALGLLKENVQTISNLLEYMEKY